MRTLWRRYLAWRAHRALLLVDASYRAEEMEEMAARQYVLDAMARAMYSRALDLRDQVLIATEVKRQ